jgi:hypothetical protein
MSPACTALHVPLTKHIPLPSPCPLLVCLRLQNLSILGGLLVYLSMPRGFAASKVKIA